MWRAFAPLAPNVNKAIWEGKDMADVVGRETIDRPEMAREEFGRGACRVHGGPTIRTTCAGGKSRRRRVDESTSHPGSGHC
jgi:hypothetical protein